MILERITLLIFTITTFFGLSQYDVKLMRNHSFEEFYGLNDSRFTAADLNGDGFQDLIIDGQQDGFFRSQIYYNNGDNTFSYQVIKQEIFVANPHHFAYDFNQDGKAELFVFLNYGGEWCISTYHIAPNGIFMLSDPQVCENGSFHEQRLVDLNLDGKPELVVSNAGFAKTYTYNLQSEKWEDQGEYSFPKNSGFEVGLITDDHYPDIMTRVYNNQNLQWEYQVHINNGSNQFNPVTVSGVENLTNVRFNFPDLDDDGLGDLVINGGGTGGVKTLAYLQTSSFNYTPLNHASIDTLDSYFDIELADFDEDGNKDVALTPLLPYQGQPNLLLRNTGNSNFEGWSFPGVIEPELMKLQMFDLNNDSHEEILLTSFQDGRCINQVYELSGNTYEAKQKTLKQMHRAFPRGEIIADFTGDGKDDIFYSSFSQSGGAILTQFRLMEQTASGFTHIEEAIAPFSTGVTPNYAAGDIDGDGDMDVFFYRTSESFDLGINDGTGHFTLAPVSLPDSNIITVYLRDLNGDGKAEIIAENYSDMVIYENSGALSFTQVASVSGIIGSSEFSYADYDQNGWVDFVGDLTTDNETYLFLFDNNFSYTQVNLAPTITPNSRKNVHTGDFNNDQIPDIADIQEGFVEIFLNDGTATFTRHQDSDLYYQKTVENEIRRVVDFNGDGYDDILAGTRLINNTSYLKTNEAVIAGLYNDSLDFEYGEVHSINPVFAVTLNFGHFNNDSIFDLLALHHVDTYSSTEFISTYLPEYYLGLVPSKSDTSFNLTVCDRFIDAEGNAYTSSGTITAPINCGLGCTRQATINLTVNSSNVNVNIVDDTTIVADVSGVTYHWFKGCFPMHSWLPFENEDRITPSEKGDYFVIAEQNGCMDTSNCVTITRIASVDERKANMLKIYPNPVEDFVNIDHAQKGSQVRILDLTGKCLLKEVLTGGIHQQLDLSSFKPGAYILQLEFNGLVDSQTLLKK